MRKSQIQTVFKAGNSDVVAIPNEIKKKAGLETGSTINVSLAADGETVLVTKFDKKAKIHDKTTLTPKFFSWLESFNKQYGQALKELAEK